jgi:hypothetical protein
MKLLYIGKNYPSFVAEAKRLGVSRNIPLSTLKSLRWGEEVLCATFESYGKRNDEDKLKNIGDAHLMCSFVFHSILIKSQKVSVALNMRLWERGFIRIVEEGGSVEVDRACGSYSVGVGVITTATVEDVYLILRELQDELNIKVKLMIGGPVWEVFSPGTRLPDAVFTRNLIEIDPMLLEFKGMGIKEVVPLGMERDNRVIRVKKYEQVKVKAKVDSELSALSAAYN